MEIISQEKRKTDLANAIVARTHEVYQYDLNITNYEMLLASLVDLEWPAEWADIRGIDPHQAAAMVKPEEVEFLSKLQQKDRITALIASERVERNKAKAILDVLDSQLTGADRDSFLEAAITRYNALTSQ